MKKWLLSHIFLKSVVYSAATILNPLGFAGSEAQKKQVIKSITATVKKDYCKKINMCNYGTIWMTYKENLKASTNALAL